MTDNVAASIKARLLNVARRGGEEFELFLVRYASESFLFRLGASAVRERCVLKGAGLLALWMPDPYRATRDLDSWRTDPATQPRSVNSSRRSARCRAPKTG